MYTNPREPIRRPMTANRRDPRTGETATVLYRPLCRKTAQRQALREQGWN